MKVYLPLLLVFCAVLSCTSCNTTSDGFVDVHHHDTNDGGYPKPLGKDFDLFAPTNSRANLVFYLSYNISKMDLYPDSPTPSATVDSVTPIQCVVILSNADNGLFDTFTNVLIRYKGNTTFDKYKKQFKITFPDEHHCYGLRKVNLHSEWKDPSLIHEKLVYDFFNALGVTSPRANHVRVYIDNTADSAGYFYAGLYIMVENVDKDLLREHYGAPDNDNGNLYKAYWGVLGSHGTGFANLAYLGSGTGDDYEGGNGYAATSGGNARAYRLESNEELYMNDYTDLAKFITVLNKSNMTQLASVFDVTNFLNWLAANTLVGGWDNYWRNAQNYYLYNINNTGQWRWIAWDYDNSMGNCFSDVDPVYDDDIYYASHSELIMIQKVLAVPGWKTYYTNRIQYCIDTYFNTSHMNALVDELVSHISNYVLADTYKQYDNTQWAGNIGYTMVTGSDEEGEYGDSHHVAQHLGVKDYVSKRVASVESQIGSGGGGGYAANYSTMYIIGSFNGWTTFVLMTLTADNTWSIDLTGIASSDAYKFSAVTSWSGANWGDNAPTDGIGDLTGSDIACPLSGNVRFTFNDSSFAYSAVNY